MCEIVNGPIPDDFMKDESNRLSAAIFEGDDKIFKVVDQLLLPHEIKYINIQNSQDAFDVIRSMQVRGAPLIAIVGIRGLLLDVLAIEKITIPAADFVKLVKAKADFLISSRPTAVNLKNALNIVVDSSEVEGDTPQKLDSVQRTILKIYNDERDENRALVWNGYQEVLSTKPVGHKFTVMTICNTGSLATISWGTALGVVRALHEAGKINMVYSCETRPYLQGARLTATELSYGQVPFKLITDSMAAWVMKTQNVDVVLVGADQVALNGDTANKIGTYMLSVCAKEHNINFYPVVPFTTINKNRETGDDIPIEERPARELLTIGDTLLSNSETPVWNPAFDVTPAKFITKVITDFGNFTPDELKGAVQNM